MRLSKQQLEEIALTLENEGVFYRKYVAMRSSSFGQRREAIGSFLWDKCSACPGWFKIADVEDRDQLRRYFDERLDLPRNEINKYQHIPSVLVKDAPEPAVLPEMNVKFKPAITKMLGSKSFVSTYRAARNIDEQYAFTRTALGRLGYGFDESELPSITIAFHKALFFEGGIDIASPVFVLPTVTEEVIMNTVVAPLEVKTHTTVNGTDIASMPDSAIYNLISNQENEIKALKEINAKPKRLINEIAKREAGIAALVAYLDSKE
jgi:hypothetical protein